MFSFIKNYPFFYYSCIVLVIFISFKWILSLFKTNKNLPPCPPRLPIIGNLHQLGLSPHRSLQALSQKHGPLMLMHLGNVLMLVASSPEAAKELLKTHDIKFASRPKLRIPNILSYGSNDIVFSPYGENWRQLKSIAVVHLLNNTRVQSFQQVREKEVAFMVDEIKKSCGSLVDLNELIFCLTNNIVSRVNLGRTYGGLKFEDIMDRFLHLLGGFHVGSYIPWLAWIDRLSGLEKKAHKVVKEFDDFLERVVEEHVDKRRGVDTLCSEDHDLVDILLDVQRDNAIGFTFHRDVIKALILNSPLFYYSCIVLIILTGLKWIYTLFKTNRNLPPSPPRLPIIGNLHQLGLSPHRSLEALSKKHGPLMLIHLGNVPMLVASSPEAAKGILKTHDLKFASRPKLRIPDILLYGSNDIAFSPYGEYWRQLKSIAVVHLLNNTRVQSFQQVREKEVAFMVDKIKKSCGSLVDLNELFFWLTNNIVCRVSLGRTYGGLKFEDIMDRFLHLLGGFDVGSYIPWLAWIDRLSGLEEKAHKVAKEFDDFLECVVEEHVNKRRGMDTLCSEDHDLVDILLDVQRDNAIGFIFHRDVIKALILDVFVAGTDTTFISLVWSMSELIRNPRVMEKVQQEVTEIAQGRSMILEKDLEKMHYLKAIIKETLRLHPPLPLLLPRESIQDVKVMGYDIPAGTQAFVNVWAIGRDPTVWEEPEEFRPERFFNSSTDYKGLHFEFLPFGGGRRGCPGIPFAIIIIELALANMIYKFDLALPDEVKGKDLDMNDKYGLSLQKKSPLIVVATSRF